MFAFINNKKLSVMLYSFTLLCLGACASSPDIAQICEKRQILYKEQGMQVLAPCIIGLLEDNQRFYLAQGDRRFSYRYEGVEPYLKGRLSYIASNIAEVAPQDDLLNEEQTATVLSAAEAGQDVTQTWTFSQTQGSQTIAHLLIKQQACTNSGENLELSLTLTVDNTVYQGCGHTLHMLE